MLVFCMNRMSIDERLGSFSFFLAVALVALGHLSLARFDDGNAAGAGLVILEGARGGSWRGGKHCSITCVYAVPLIPDIPQSQVDFGRDTSTDAFPVAWAVGSNSVPQTATGTTHLHWWGEERKDYARAMDNAIAQQLPERLKACDGQQAVPDCRTESTAGKCCCPTGQQVGEDGCKGCGALKERLSALLELHLLHSIDPGAGEYSFYIMLFGSLVLLPFPWALLAQVLWQFAKPNESFLQHEAWEQRKHFAETWIGNLHGPSTINVANLAGECRPIPGFRETSLLLHLRRSVAEVFSVNFLEVGLVFGGELLLPDLDFKTLGDLDIYDGRLSALTLGSCRDHSSESESRSRDRRKKREKDRQRERDRERERQRDRDREHRERSRSKDARAPKASTTPARPPVPVKTAADIAREKAEFEAFCQAEAWVSMVVAFNIVALGSTGKQKKAHTHANGNEFS
ncbi:Cap-specific mRNA (Nucleoside-2'-O-)-methyltransferase 1 [Durusdinium trenchii]|uniref:Cap-specific mRNA (Nucleoside-2'-O-)-methyltransferase 1 n=1 Tax=Durusdinium trenchii TaxID=1381693 RepID=A0ABP0NEV6_9DINO